MRFLKPTTFTANLLLAGALLAAAACGSSAPSATEAPPRYSEQEIDYYLDIAIGSEYDSPEVIKKWDQPVRVAVGGTPTEADRAALAQVVRDLDEETGDRLDVALVEEDDDGEKRANAEVLFVPVDSMRHYNSNYEPGNVGYFYIWWNGGYEIQRAQVLVGSRQTSPGWRAHLVREELTQSLGLMNDSPRYSDSVFQTDYTETTDFSTLDRTVIEMHYQSVVRAGMSRADARRALERLSPSS